MIGKFIHKLVAKKYLIRGGAISCSEAALQLEIAQIEDDIYNAQEEIGRLQAMNDEAIAQLTASKDSNKKRLGELQLVLEDLTAQLEQAQAELEDVRRQIKPVEGFDLLPEATKKILNDYYDKYKEKFITYNGRTIGIRNPTPVSFYVQDFAQYGKDSPEVKQLVNEAGANVFFIIKEKECDFHRACDYAVARVKKRISRFYNYVFDNTNFGTGEYWMFAVECLLLKAGDCEDWAHLNYACCRAAGVPAKMLRITCGMTYGGEGHSTNHYYASDEKWHHINSTTSYPSLEDALNTPLNNTPEPSNLGLKSIWFSFNEERSFSEFTTDAQKESYEKEKDNKLLKHIKIRKKGWF